MFKKKTETYHLRFNMNLNQCITSPKIFAFCAIYEKKIVNLRQVGK